MSRVGKKPIEIPKGVEVKLEDGRIHVKGPKGSLVKDISRKIKVSLKEAMLEFSIKEESKEIKSLYGLTRSLVANMIEGVTKGFEKRLNLSGVGYKASKQGRKLILQMGFSHPIEIDPPEGVEIVTEAAGKIKVLGADRELVGLVAANIRSVRPVEPYKAKGIKYAGEQVRRKAGKAVKGIGVTGA